MNNALSGIAFQWVYDTLNERRDINERDGYNVDEDSLSMLIEDMSVNTERDFTRYCEDGANQLPFNLHCGLKAWFTINGKRFKSVMSSDKVDEDTRSLVLDWLNNCLGTYDLIYNFRDRLQELSEHNNID